MNPQAPRPDAIRRRAPLVVPVLLVLLGAATSPTIFATVETVVSITPVPMFRTVVVNPPLTLQEMVTVWFEYESGAAECQDGHVCVPEWRILTGGTEQDGPLPVGEEPDGNLVAHGVGVHDGGLQRVSYSLDTGPAFSASGTFAVKAAVRAVADDGHPWTVRTTSVTVLPTDDFDKDTVPDALETALCSPWWTAMIIDYLSDGEGGCNGSDYTPGSTIIELAIPFQATTATDADGDAIPSSIDVWYTTISFRHGLLRSPADGGFTRQRIDFDEDDATLPHGIFQCSRMQIPSGVGVRGDRDDDGLPGLMLLTQGEACVDPYNPGVVVRDMVAWRAERKLDPDDFEANPQTSMVSAESVALWAEFDHDADRDGIPASRSITSHTYTYDKSVLSAFSYTTHTVTTQIDPDDEVIDEPVPFQPVDLDNDHVPDGAEVHLCQIDDVTTSADGRCGHPANYVPPPLFPSRARGMCFLTFWRVETTCLGAILPSP